MTDRDTRKRATAAALGVLKDHMANGTLRQAIAGLGVAPSPPDQFWRINLDAILFWREFVKSGGITLDPALWRGDGNAAGELAQAIEGAIVRGWSGARSACYFLHDEGIDRQGLMNVPVPERNDFDHPVWTAVDFWFWREVNRSHLAVQVAQGIAHPSELAALDDTDVIPPPPSRAP